MIISQKEFSSATKLDKLKVPGLAFLLMELMRLNEVNRFYKKISDKQGLDFIDAALEALGIKIELDENELKNIPKEKGFIAIANHPYGGVEGLILLKILCQVRPEMKVMVNFILKKIPNISDYFIAVNPFEKLKSVSSLAGLKSTLELLEQGNPIGIFPAGEVSAYNPNTNKVMDKKWSPMVGKIATKANTHVLPVYFHGNNGLLFNLLGLIHPSLRTAKLPSELFNKKGFTIKVRIGKPIPPEEIQSFSSNDKLMTYLRARTYALGSGIEVKKFYMGNFLKLNKRIHDIIPETDQKAIIKEVEALSDRLIYSEKNYDVYVAGADRIPQTLQEIGRLREITFREVGEGTNKKIDLDDFDFYYHHLFIWDRDEKKLVGAYRIGKGNEIFFRYGIKGFYITQLFKVKRGIHSIMKDGLELGRSWVRKEYQQKPLPLFLLWKGILIFIIKNPEFRYLFGPVSISNNFSKLSKHLLVRFIEQHYFDSRLAKFVSPKNKFKVKLPDIDPQVLLEKLSSIKSLDALISEIELNHNKVPVLVRQYIQLNAKIISFNVDPKFNDSIDGFLLLDLKNVPEDTIKMLSKNL